MFFCFKNHIERGRPKDMSCVCLCVCVRKEESMNESVAILKSTVRVQEAQTAGG